MKATELDEKFDNNEDISSYYDLTTIQQPGLEIKRVTVYVPVEGVDHLKLNEIMLTKKSV